MLFLNWRWETNWKIRKKEKKSMAENGKMPNPPCCRTTGSGAYYRRRRRRSIRVRLVAGGGTYPPPTPSDLALGWYWCRGQVPNLLDEEFPLVDELLVVGPVLEEVRQEAEQLFAVHDQDLLDGDRLIGVRHEHLEHVETFVLHHLALVAQQVHADLEVLPAIHVLGHDSVVGPVQQDLAQQLDRLPLGHVAAGLHEHVVVLVEEALEVDGQVPRDDVLVPSKELLPSLCQNTHPEMGTAATARKRTRNVVKASAATSNELLSIHSKNFQKTPLPDCGRLKLIAFRPCRLEPCSSLSS